MFSPLPSPIRSERTRKSGFPEPGFLSNRVIGSYAHSVSYLAILTWLRCGLILNLRIVHGRTGRRVQGAFAMATGCIEERQVRHARIELSPKNHERLKAAADRDRRSIASFMRLAVLDRIAESESKSR